MQLKIAARFFYRSSSRLLYAGECKGTNILCYLVNEMPACYHKYRKKKKEQVYYEGIKPSGTDNKNVFDRNLS